MSALTAPLKRTSPAPAAPPRRSGHLRVVEETSRRHTLAYALVMITLLAGTVFGAVTLNALAAAAAVEARALDAEVVEGERTYAQLVADVAALEDPARVREQATELGLVPAGPMRYVQLERNLPSDGVSSRPVQAGTPTDPLKPLLTAER